MIDTFKKTLWATADKLRANMDAAEYKHLVLGLIFVKYISDTFAAHQAELVRRFADEADDYHLADATPEDIAAELEDRDYYRAANVFWVPEAARWEALRAAAKQPDIGKRIDDALALIEAENPSLKNILDKRYARAVAQKQLPGGAAASSTRPAASSRRWWPCWRRTTARCTTRAAAAAACSCRAKRSSRRTAASVAMCPSTGKRPTPPPGAWRP